MLSFSEHTPRKAAIKGGVVISDVNYTETTIPCPHTCLCSARMYLPPGQLTYHVTTSNSFSMEHRGVLNPWGLILAVVYFGVSGLQTLVKGFLVPGCCPVTGAGCQSRERDREEEATEHASDGPISRLLSKSPLGACPSKS